MVGNWRSGIQQSVRDKSLNSPNQSDLLNRCSNSITVIGFPRLIHVPQKWVKGPQINLQRFHERSRLPPHTNVKFSPSRLLRGHLDTPRISLIFLQITLASTLNPRYTRKLSKLLSPPIRDQTELASGRITGCSTTTLLPSRLRATKHENRK